MPGFTRRDFLKSTVAVSAVAASGGALTAAAAKRSATDWVTLGNSGVKVTRLAFGTGTRGGMIQRQLGQDDFTRLVRHAYDSGIRFFETADSYRGMPEMLATALKGIPRDSYRLMTKMGPRQPDPAASIDNLRTALGSEYIDIVLLHGVRTADWPQEREATRDALSLAKQKKIVLAHGASVHGLVPLRVCPGTKWLDVALLRINHNGTMMDNLRGDAETGDVAEVTAHAREIHGQGIGVISMKAMGEGRFTTPEDRDASIKYIMGLGVVDSTTIGYKSPAEIDEAIERIDTHLNAS
jgi:aryl-alcohol dehydrogenase-like predicted oxidoreductase